MTSTLTPLNFHYERKLLSNEVVTVSAIRPDTLIKQFNLTKVNLMKMDIEGAELHILTDHKLDLTPVEAMIIEVHYPFISPQSKDIISSLKSKGFRLLRPFLGPDKQGCHLYSVKYNKR